MTSNLPPSDFPRRSAATRRFTLGAPRSFTVAPDGSRVLFLRSEHGADPVQSVWLLDPTTGDERCLADPRSLAADDEDLPAEERARRERAREQATGIVRYATDRQVRRVVFTLGGALLLTDVDDGTTTVLDVPGPVVDPRLDPSGRRVAWVAGGALHTVDVDVDDPRPSVLAEDDDTDVTWGLAEFVAAEEMRRSRGFWWAPDGDRLLAARVDEGRVARWHLSEPADPAASPRPLRFPAAGTPNADVSLAVVGLDGSRVDVLWDRDALPYLVSVGWQADAPPTFVVQSRDQRRMEVRTLDPSTGESALAAGIDGDPWVEIVPGAPVWIDGALVTVADDTDAGPGGTRRVSVDGTPVSPAGLQVREVVGSDQHSVMVTASAADPTEVGVWRVPLDGGEPSRLDAPGGVSTSVGKPSAHVLHTASIESAPVATVVTSSTGRRTVPSRAEAPGMVPRVELTTLGPAHLQAALLLPRDHGPGDPPLPVLVDPYGGPHAQRVLRNRAGFLTSQWFADAGFAVLVVDGRGTPGRGPDWEHAVAGDLATAPLDDQVDALERLAARRPGLLDLERVGIRGWSFGGYLAALAVLRRPDVFRAAIAGAPVTDWRLYDTHYTERYLGDPAQRPDDYARSSLLDDAHRLERPLLLIHGFADDNVVAAHTMRLSRALLEAGRPHRVLPLSGVSHMTPQEVVAENLLRLQVDFLHEALGPRGEQPRLNAKKS